MAGRYQGPHLFDDEFGRGCIEVVWQSSGWFWRTCQYRPCQTPSCQDHGDALGPFNTSSEAYQNAKAAHVRSRRSRCVGSKPSPTRAAILVDPLRAQIYRYCDHAAEVEERENGDLGYFGRVAFKSKCQRRMLGLETTTATSVFVLATRLPFYFASRWRQEIRTGAVNQRDVQEHLDRRQG
jgi:hypothetical protein